MATVTALHPSQHIAPPVPSPAHQTLTTNLSTPAPSSIGGPVTATLNFFKAPEDGSPPHNYVEKPTDGRPQRNFGDEPTQIHLSDVRGSESSFSLANNAFACLSGPYPQNPNINWDDDATVKQHYYPEVEELLLKHVPGARRIILFDHTVRRANPDAHRLPVTRVHIDQTPMSTAARVRRHGGDDADELLKGRYRIINVWRPINGRVESFPLGFADSGSVSDDALVPVEHRYPTHNGQTAVVRWTEGQKWFYWGGMDEGERLLLQCADSADWATRVPHCAFVDPRSGEGAKQRESIEVRALVLG